MKCEIEKQIIPGYEPDPCIKAEPVQIGQSQRQNGQRKGTRNGARKKEGPLPRTTTEVSATVHPASSVARDSSGTNKCDGSYQDHWALRQGPRPTRAGLGYRRPEAYEHRTENPRVGGSIDSDRLKLILNLRAAWLS